MVAAEITGRLRRHRFELIQLVEHARRSESRLEDDALKADTPLTDCFPDERGGVGHWRLADAVDQDPFHAAVATTDDRRQSERGRLIDHSQRLRDTPATQARCVGDALTAECLAGDDRHDHVRIDNELLTHSGFERQETHSKI